MEWWASEENKVFPRRTEKLTRKTIKPETLSKKIWSRG
jgi:hypothetical protein